MAARWAFLHGVRKIEFWNEPDLGQSCMTYYSWLDTYTLQSQAIQNAFADLNADVASALVPCPVAACPLQPLIYASAFASAGFSGTNNAGTGPYSATYPSDSYPYFGQPSVQFEHTPFPPFPGSGTTSAAPVAGLQNMNAYSMHTYGKTGYQLASLATGLAAQINASRPLPLPASQLTLPFVVTEHATHTTNVFNNISSTLDTGYEASRLGGQVLYQALNGFESYIFKFSALEQSSNIVPGCIQGTGVAGSATACGVQKTGLHWAEAWPPLGCLLPHPPRACSLLARLILTARIIPCRS